MTVVWEVLDRVITWDLTYYWNPVRRLTDCVYAYLRHMERGEYITSLSDEYGE